MMSQEEYMDLVRLRADGLSYVEIGERLGYHPATIAKWVREGGPPARRGVPVEERTVDDRWGARVDALLDRSPKLLSTSVFEILTAEGFDGSYPSVVRAVRERRGPRFRAAKTPSVPIETPPGAEAQFDWCDCTVVGEAWGLGELQCFGIVLCWSRARFWWFTTCLDRHHTLEGIVRGFEDFEGVPASVRTDRMGALGTSQGRRFSLHAPTLDFARHHGVEVAVCRAGDAKRKGKVERPFRDLRETFLTEVDLLGPPGSVAELNQRAQRFLAERVHARPHRSTGEAPAARLALERRFLSPLPRARFDTAYREPRRVHRALPLLEWHGVCYSVPHEVLGAVVECRVELGSDVLQVRFAGREIARHRLAPKGVAQVWDPAHRQRAEQAALSAAFEDRPRLRLLTTTAAAGSNGDETAGTARLDLEGGDFDVAPPDLGRYDLGGDAS